MEDGPREQRTARGREREREGRMRCLRRLKWNGANERVGQVSWKINEPEFHPLTEGDTVLTVNWEQMFSVT